MKQRQLSEQELFRKAMLLARIKGIAFGVEYYPERRSWRASIIEKQADSGGWSEYIGHGSRRASLVAVIKRLEET